MRRVETYIRTAELGLALASTYLTAVSLLQTSLYVRFKPLVLSLLSRGEALLGAMRVDLAYFDLSLLILAMLLSLLFWRRGGEAGFGRLFSLNMLMFFPCVLDFSMFNWINLILPYDPAPSLPPIQVFGVGLLLQATYIALRNTVRFRDVRRELEGRGAEAEDVDAVSRGQMAYLALLMAGTAAVVASIYYATPLVKGLITLEAEGLPYPHVVIGLACSVLIALATIIYLRGNEARDTK
ncbi:hypothetical protein AC482_05295 [miscellaneous Crenarchaeota group-15 archaeon DG-45]|uniref:Uncharacterized protein n=1 Tax=miscellaneous Crenarchaeota group-15 archaeon DG-45 TaxID=1685127 RepID=A0A0M0BMT5_9ARCH|nr:MAG: hypothetical protein AC482_05295 [miscellaneous Crenarchaeota group-15 archaeon DG-45]